MHRVSESRPVPRRAFIAGAAATAAAAACSTSTPRSTRSAAPTTPATEVSSPSSTSPVTPPFVSAGARDRTQVALTFHVSGDRAQAVRMLDLLKAHQTPVTAFIVGTWLEANADLVARFVDDGHELANHTYTHPTFPSLDRAAMTTEVAGCRDVLVRLAGRGGDYFRPSGTTNGVDDPGPTVIDVARVAGYPTVVGYDVDPADYQDPGATAIVQRTLDVLQPGSIVSLHFGHAGTIDAMPELLTALDARGLRPVAVNTLLAP
ncbi:MAG: hypothetical protein QOH79_2700 [Acidimicrobiaceae bacterium]